MPVKHGNTRYQNIGELQKAVPHVKFRGGAPDSREACRTRATYKVKKLDDATVLLELCRAIGPEVAHMLQKSIQVNERSLYPMLLCILDILMRLSSSNSQARYVADDEEYPEECGSARNSTKSSPNARVKPAPATAAPATAAPAAHQQEQAAGSSAAVKGPSRQDSQQKQFQQQQQQEQQQQQHDHQDQPAQQHEPSTPSASRPKSVEAADSNALSVRLAHEHEHVTAISKGPIEFVLYDKKGLARTVIEAKYSVDKNFSKYAAQTCLELICLAVKNAELDPKSEEVFGWLTDTECWVGMCFKLDERPAKGRDTPLSQIKGTIQFSRPLIMMSADLEQFMDHFPHIVSELARRLLPGPGQLHNIPKMLARYKEEMDKKAARMMQKLTNLTSPSTPVLPRKREHAEVAAAAAEDGIRAAANSKSREAQAGCLEAPPAASADATPPSAEQEDAGFEEEDLQGQADAGVGDTSGDKEADQAAQTGSAAEYRAALQAVWQLTMWHESSDAPYAQLLKDVGDAVTNLAACSKSSEAVEHQTKVVIAGRALLQSARKGEEMSPQQVTDLYGALKALAT